MMSSEPVPAEKSTVRFEFAYDGGSEGITFAVDERVKLVMLEDAVIITYTESLVFPGTSRRDLQRQF